MANCDTTMILRRYYLTVTIQCQTLKKKTNSDKKSKRRISKDKFVRLEKKSLSPTTVGVFVIA